MEKIKIPEDLVARCEWRSSIWRLWIVIHSTAWFIDPWFEWTITLEITNINNIPIALYPWMRIWQFAFETMAWKVEIPYNKRKWSKYMHQIKPEASRIVDDEY
jgi:dCTP deaminase